jgi:hypothetical protein
MPTVVTLPAGAYETEIRDIDRLVFEERPITDVRRTALAKRLEGLADRVFAEAKRSKSKFLALESLEIRHLANISKRLEEKPPPQPLLDNWMRLRNNLFEDREWMARSARDLEAIAAMPVATPAAR